jgi:hypothetical protein
LVVGLVIGGLLVALLACIPVLIAFGVFDEPKGLDEPPAGPPVEEPTPDDPELATLPPLAFFRDVTTESGVNLICRNGEESEHRTILESLGGGVALIDYDGDGLLDIFLVGGGEFAGADKREIRGLPGRFYKNLGNWKFRDVTAEVGLDQTPFYAHGCAVADYDRDGWPDLLVTGYRGLVLYHNEPDGKGGRHFVDVTAQARLQDSRWNTSAGWADLDGDGYPDLYVCHYVDWSWQTHKACAGDNVNVLADVCPPAYFKGTPHTVYRNNGDGTFTDVSREAGIRQGPSEAGMGLGVVIVDVDGDGKPDVYAVNDTTMNFLYLNRSIPGKIRFEDVGLLAGVALGERGRPDGSMGVDAADYDGTGRPSLWVTTFEHERHALYRNESRDGRTLFRYVTREAGIASLGSGYVGFGTAFVDVDNDGWEDLVIANGHVRRSPTRSAVQQKAVLLVNRGTGHFANRTAQGGSYFQVPHRGRGLAAGDLDNDGRVDLVISHLNEPAAVLRNDPQGERAPHNHWLGIELVGKDRRDVAGATIVVEAGGRKLTRFAKGGGSYLSANDRRIVVGLGAAERVDRVTVHWPWGDQQQWTGLSADRYWKLVEAVP